MRFGHIVKKHPWAFGGAIYGIISGLSFGGLIRKAVESEISQLIINEAGFSNNAIVKASIIIIPLVVLASWGALMWSIIGALYRGLKSRQLLERYRWWAVSGAAFGVIGGTFGGVVMGLATGQMIVGEMHLPNGELVIMSIMIVWVIVSATMGAFMWIINGVIIGFIIDRWWLYVIWGIASIYIGIQYSGAIIPLMGDDITSFSKGIAIVLIIAFVGWAIIKSLELQKAFEEGIRKLFDRLWTAM